MEIHSRLMLRPLILSMFLSFTSGQQMLSPAPRIVSLTASNPSTASGDISFYSDGCKMTIQFDISTDTGE